MRELELCLRDLASHPLGGIWHGPLADWAVRIPPLSRRNLRLQEKKGIDQLILEDYSDWIQFNFFTVTTERDGWGGAGSQRRRHSPTQRWAALDARLLRIVIGRIGQIVVRFQQENGADVELRYFVEDGQRQYHEDQSNQQVN